MAKRYSMIRKGATVAKSRFLSTENALKGTRSAFNLYRREQKAAIVPTALLGVFLTNGSAVVSGCFRGYVGAQMADPVLLLIGGIIGCAGAFLGFPTLISVGGGMTAVALAARAEDMVGDWRDGGGTIMGMFQTNATPQGVQ